MVGISKTPEAAKNKHDLIRRSGAGREGDSKGTVRGLSP